MSMRWFYNGLKTLCTLFLVAISILFFVPIIFCLLLLPAPNRYDNTWFFWLMSRWSGFFLWSSFIEFVIEGKENIPQYNQEPVVVAVNHTSSLDIPVVDMLLGSYPHVWISKDYSKVPFLNFMLHRMHVQVSAFSLRRSLNTVTRVLHLTRDKKRHVVLFPEGRRYADGSIHTLRSGFAVFAEELNRPILPIMLYGLHNVFPKKSLIINSTNVRVFVSIGKPIVKNENESREEFVDKVSNWFKLEHDRLSLLSR